MQITQKDILALFQSSIESSLEIRFLDNDKKLIGYIEGNLISGNSTIDSESDIRRTMSLELYVTNSSYNLSENGVVWVSRYIEPYYKVKYIPTNEMLSYSMGQYLFSTASYKYNATTNSVSLNCVDRMVELNGDRGGKLRRLSTMIEQGADIRNAIISTLQNFTNIDKYLVTLKPWGNVANYNGYEWNKLPYELSFSSEDTVYSVLTKFKEILAGHEMFFDKDVFVFQPIPEGDNDPVIADDYIFSRVLIDEDISNNLLEVKNCISVWGAMLETHIYTENCTNTSARYNLAIEPFSFVEKDNPLNIIEGALIGFKANVANLSNPTIRINDLSAYPIVDINNTPIAAGVIKPNIGYVVKYSNSKFIFLGQFQIHAVVKLVSSEPSQEQKDSDIINEQCDFIYYQVNPNSPYTIEKIGEIRDVKSGGVYEKIYSVDLAIQRGKLELYKTSRLTDSITLNIVTIPWLDVNKKVEYTSIRSGETKQYIIKSITKSLSSGTSTVNMVSYYPEYPFI